MNNEDLGIEICNPFENLLKDEKEKLEALIKQHSDTKEIFEFYLKCVEDKLKEYN